MIVFGIMLLAVLLAFFSDTSSGDPTQGYDDPPCVCDHDDKKWYCDGRCQNKPDFSEWPPCRCDKQLNKCDYNCKYSNDL